MSVLKHSPLENVDKGGTYQQADQRGTRRLPATVSITWGRGRVGLGDLVDRETVEEQGGTRGGTKKKEGG